MICNRPLLVYTTGNECCCCLDEEEPQGEWNQFTNSSCYDAIGESVGESFTIVVAVVNFNQQWVYGKSFIVL